MKKEGMLPNLKKKVTQRLDASEFILVMLFNSTTLSTRLSTRVTRYNDEKI